MVFAGIVTAVIAYILKATMGWRVDDEVEQQGIDFNEHGESAYDTTGPEIR